MFTEAPQAPVQLEQVLSYCLSDDNQVRKRAEEYLKERLQHVDAFTQLVETLQGCHVPQVRQLAAVLLRKRIGKKWAQLPAEVQRGTQQVLLQRIVEEAVGPVKRAVAHVVGVIAQHAVPRQQWPELLQFLYQCSQSHDATHREIALTLFSSLAGTISDELRPHAISLMQVMTKGLQDPHPDVVSAALQAVEPLLVLVNSQEEVAAFHFLLAELLQLSARLMSSGEEEMLLSLFQVLSEVSDVAAPLLQPALVNVVELCGGVGSNKGMQTDTRGQALEVLHVIVRNKPKQLTKSKLVGNLVDAMCELACENVVASTAAGDEDEALELAPCRMACQLIDDMALNLPSKEVFPKVMSFVQRALASPDPNHRCGCLNVLAAVCEGCCESMRSKLKEVLGPVLQGLQDPEVQVRGSAVFALAQYSDFLQPEMGSQHALVLPLVLQAMQEPTKSVQERAFCALDAFCENMGPEIGDYVEQLVGKIMEVLGGGNREMQEMALSALASMLSAASHPFKPFAATLVPMLEHFMQLTAPDALDCRCRATECAGFIVDVVAPDALPAVADRLMELGLRGFAIQYPSLKEYTHDMFGHVAKTLGAGFVKYLQYVVPLALESCQLQDLGAYSDEDDDEDSDAEAGNKAGDGILQDISDDEEDGQGRHLSVRTGVTDEKAAATQALGLYATSTQTAFGPFLEESLRVLKGMAIYFHEGVRSQAYEALSRLVVASTAIFPPPSGSSGASAGVQQLMGGVMELLLRAVTEDNDKLAAAAALSAELSMVKALGVTCMAPFLEPLMEGVKKVLSMDTVSQSLSDEEEGDGEEDEGDGEDEELFATACESFPVMAEAVGEQAYGPVFAQQHFPLLAAHLKPQGTPNGWRATVTGCLAEVTQKIQGHMGPHVEKLVPALMRETRVDDSMNRQNASFCLGVLVQACPQQCAPFFTQILQALHPLCSQQDESPSVRDNAVGAVSRMLLAAAPALPVEQILPSLLGALPIREDMSECVPAYQALCYLLTSDQAVRCSACLPQMFAALGGVLVQQRTEQVRGSVAAVVAQLQQQHSQQIGQLLGSWTEQQRAALAAALACQPQE